MKIIIKNETISEGRGGLLQMDVDINDITIPNTVEEAVPVIELCDLLKTHTPVSICYDLKICKNCGALMDNYNTMITNHDWPSYRPALSQLRDVDGGEPYLKIMRSWILSAKASGVALAYSEATNDFSDDIDTAIVENGIKWLYIQSMLSRRKYGLARQHVLKHVDMLHTKSKEKYYFGSEVEWYNRVANAVTKRRVELNDRNKAVRELMKQHKGAERQLLVFELEENIAKRKRLKDVERAAYTRKMDMRRVLSV